jgi:hypothetical protein
MKRVLLLALLLTACVQMPPSPADMQAKRFEPVPDKAVLYVVRPPLDSDHPGVLVVDTGEYISTMPGTYNRIELKPGMRVIEGMIPPSLRITLNAQPGQIYFMRLDVRGTSRGGPTTASLQLISPEWGRTLVAQGSLYP